SCRAWTRRWKEITSNEEGERWAEPTQRERTLSEKRRKPKSKAPPGNGGGAGAAGPMNVGFLQQLVDLMASNDLNTVDLRESGKRIILKRGATQVQNNAPAPAAHPPAALPSGSASAPASPSAAATDEDSGLVAIKSPMVGTFYAAASP